MNQCLLDTGQLNLIGVIVAIAIGIMLGYLLRYIADHNGKS